MYRRRLVPALAALLVLIPSGPGRADDAQTPSHRATLERALVTPGRTTLALSVVGDAQQTVVPVSVVTGTEPGPVLLVLAGIHGSEHAPILATQRLAPELDPRVMHGSVVFVHIANLPAYLGRTVYTSPADGKNLNRMFPGDPAGTLSERIAHTLTHEVYPLADAVLDVHSGDANEQLAPFWTGFYERAGDAEVIAASRAMAQAFGIRHIVAFQWQFDDPGDAIWAGSAAVARGIPSIDVEAGGMGIVDDDAVTAITTGIRRVMAHLGITDVEFEPSAEPVFIRDRQSVRAPRDGSWHALIDAGTNVKRGELIGYLTDWYGRRVFEARAPMDGLLLIRLEAPPVREGETLATVARVAP